MSNGILQLKEAQPAHPCAASRGCDGGGCGSCQVQPLPLGKTAGLEGELKERRGKSHLDDIKEVA